MAAHLRPRAQPTTNRKGRSESSWLKPAAGKCSGVLAIRPRARDELTLRVRHEFIDVDANDCLRECPDKWIKCSVTAAHVGPKRSDFLHDGRMVQRIDKALEVLDKISVDQLVSRLQRALEGLFNAVAQRHSRAEQCDQLTCRLLRVVLKNRSRVRWVQSGHSESREEEEQESNRVLEALAIVRPAPASKKRGCMASRFFVSNSSTATALYG